MLILAGLLLPWLNVAPNRLLPGAPVGGLAALGWAVLALPLAALAVPRAVPAWAGAMAALAAALLLLAGT
ncbi:ABC transporter permease, partial [Roseomonas sp. BU-1]|nr:ABC transporter permease [Falsiroseomonas selenitidurans]